MTFVPELLSPAGSLDKLKVAAQYGADAVFLAGQKFGLRSAAKNFTYEELREASEFVHRIAPMTGRRTKIYAVLNSFLHDSDFDGLPEFLKELEHLKIDGLIVSDLGVIDTIKNTTDLVVHLSTQASCLNTEGAKLWKKMGVERVVLGREASIADAARMKDKADLEVELFIHGSMCMAFSGHCVISNYTQGRDSNRGGCAHSCRFEYGLSSLDGKNLATKTQEKHVSTFMSSKDLMGITLIPDFVRYEIDSLKVEGRMKSYLYAGTISKIYREAIDDYTRDPKLFAHKIPYYQNELNKISHRDYTEASLVNPAGLDSIYDERQAEDSEARAIGIVQYVTKDFLVLEVRSPFQIGETLEVMPFQGEGQFIKVNKILTITNESKDRVNPGQMVKIPLTGTEKNISEYNLVRISGDQTQFLPNRMTSSQEVSL